MFSYLTKLVRDEPCNHMCRFFDSRLVLCGFPGDATLMKLPPPHRCFAPFPLVELAAFVKQEGKPFLVFNLSGHVYDYNCIQDQVVAYSLHDNPAPPFHLLLELVDSVKGWIQSMSDNLAIVHDVSGRRSIVVAICVLASIKHDSFPQHSPIEITSNILNEVVTTIGGPATALGNPSSCPPPSLDSNLQCHRNTGTSRTTLYICRRLDPGQVLHCHWIALS